MHWPEDWGKLRNTQPKIWRNMASSAKVDATSNVVKMKTEFGRQTREMVSGGGHVSGRVGRLHLGSDDATNAHRLQILCTSGLGRIGILHPGEHCQEDCHPEVTRHRDNTDALAAFIGRRPRSTRCRSALQL